MKLSTQTTWAHPSSATEAATRRRAPVDSAATSPASAASSAPKNKSKLPVPSKNVPQPHKSAATPATPATPLSIPQRSASHVRTCASQRCHVAAAKKPAANHYQVRVFCLFFLNWRHFVRSAIPAIPAMIVVRRRRC